MDTQSRQWIRRVVCGLAIVVSGLAGREVWAAEKAKRSRRIAILRLRNLRPGTDTDWIGEGVAETLTTKLGQLPELITVERAQISKVIEERKFQAAFGDIKTAAKVGKLVGAERVLLGSYVKAGANIQFNVRVVDVATGVVLNRASLTRPARQIFDAQYALAEAVIESFKKKGVVVDNRPAVVDAAPAERIVLTPQQARKLKEWGTTSPDAYESACRGFAAGDPARKIRWYTRAIALDRGYAWAYYNRGIVHRNAGDFDRALRDYDKAIDLDGGNPAFYSNRGVAYANKGEYDRAVRDYDKAVELDPTHFWSYYNRGLAYFRRGDHDRAIRDYDKALELNPTYTRAYNNRGLAFYRKGDRDRAIRDYDVAVTLDPRYADAYTNRGLAHAGKGAHDRAVRDYDKAVELNPADPAVYNNRAIAHYHLRNYKQAWSDVKACQRRAGQVHPGFLAALRKAAPQQK